MASADTSSVAQTMIAMASAELIEPPSSSPAVIARPDEGSIGPAGESRASKVRARQACSFGQLCREQGDYSSPRLWLGLLAHWKKVPMLHQASATKARSAMPMRTRRKEGRLPEGCAIERIRDGAAA